MINLSINNQRVSVQPGTTVLEAARKLNINIPTLCNHPDLCVAGNCRVCVVEQTGARTLIAACAMPAAEGMDIQTNTLKVRNARKHIVELLLSEHRSDCTKCYKNQKCELQRLANEFAFGDTIFLDLVQDRPYTIDRSSPSFIKDDSKCIRCQRCVRTCTELQHISAIAVANKGMHQKISSFHDRPMSHVVCTNCGQCVNRCPTGALVEKTYIDQVWDAIYDPEKHVVVQTAPAVRVALGEDLGYDPGERVTGKMVTALRQLGFDSVLDTDFSADLTIMEEGTELLTRLKKVLVDGDKKTSIPMFTSCSPGWIKFIEHKYPPDRQPARPLDRGGRRRRPGGRGRTRRGIPRKTKTRMAGDHGSLERDRSDALPAGSPAADEPSPLAGHPRRPRVAVPPDPGILLPGRGRTR